MISDRSRLQATLGRPELKRLVERLRTRVERGGLLTGVLTLSKATPTERDAVNRLLGRLPSRGSTLVIDLGQLEDKLRAAGLAANLRVAVEQITGAIVDRHAQREIEEREWKNLFFDASKKVENRPELQTWITQLRLTGSLRRYGITDARKLVQQALDIITALPAQDTPLAELAASILGDAHALDPDTSLSSIILRAVAVLGKCEKFDDAQSRRDAWASVGVVCDELSAAVLVLNLRSSDNTAVGRVLRIYAESGEPTFLSVRQLLRTPPMFTISDVGPVVYVCENPSVGALTARLFPFCPRKPGRQTALNGNIYTGSALNARPQPRFTSPAAHTPLGSLRSAPASGQAFSAWERSHIELLEPGTHFSFTHCHTAAGRLTFIRKIAFVSTLCVWN
jgi:uncharacterized protein (TIGR02679 family)